MSGRQPKAAISWSGGKDCCLALLRAREAGLDVATFLTMCDVDGASQSHAVSGEVMAAQVAAFGGHWLPVAVAPADYGFRFDVQLHDLAADGHTHVVFGDIDLKAHRDWLEPRCVAAGLTASFPLWDERRRDVAWEILQRGIRAYVVGIDLGRLAQRFCGVRYDAGFLAALPPDICPCGEDGEFHTFVTWAPGMTAELPVGLGEQRIVAAPPPLSPTRLAFQSLFLLPVSG